jgi:hypothetical protein
MMAGAGKSVVVLLCGWLLLPAIPVRACNVPVFRYALEHWATDPYEAFVFHRGPLTEADRAAVALLAKAAPTLTLHTVDLDQQPEDAARDLFEAQPSPTLPWLVVRYPTATRAQETAWAGPLQTDAVRALLESPARREVAHRLHEGESVVWLLLDGGTKEQDDAAEQLLRSESATLPKTLHLPAPGDLADDEPGQGTETPLRVAFSVVRVARTDPAEAALVQLLLHTEPDLSQRQEPMVFPVFGRGRVLYALVGPGISASNLREAAVFLTGACSCRVKQENPGIDLLLTIGATAAAAVSARPAEPAPPSPAAEQAAPLTEREAAADATSSRWLDGLLATLLVLGGLTGAVLFHKGRGRLR